jgi:hypothetical protein
MSRRSIVIDKTVIDQLNKGNRPLAQFFNSLRSTVNLASNNNANLDITAGEYARLNEAERALCDDMGVRHVNSDATYVNTVRNRVGTLMNYIKTTNPDALKNIAPEHEATIGLALGGAELLTFDKKLADSYGELTRNSQFKVVPELQGIPVSNMPVNYNGARTNLGLRAINISPSTGGVLPAPSVTRVKIDSKTTGFVDAEGNSILSGGGPRTAGGATTTNKTSATVGDRITVPEEHGLSARGDAAAQGAIFVLMGVNYVLKKIADHVQERRFNEVWARRKPLVDKRLKEDPQLGAKIFVYYSKYASGEASVADGAMIFQDIHIAYGFTEDEALRTLSAETFWTEHGPGALQVGDAFWIKPRAPLDIKKLQLPVGTEVAGLATFVPGKEKFVRVDYSILGGFDDRTISRQILHVPEGMMPRFFYLWPPKYIAYMYNGFVRQADVDSTISGDADESANVMIKPLKGIPVVKLDSHINPSTWFSDGATAAMVWPADNSTANLFQTTRPTHDPNALLAGSGYNMVRWVRPEFIRVLRDPVF